jgi:predicted metal-binding transcription factor (methanogenesis marker protein 9)
MSSVNKINRECPVWEKLLIEVNDSVEHEPNLKEFFTKAILDFSDIESSISYVLANQLQQNGFNLEKTQSIIYNAFISEEHTMKKL